MRVSLSTGLKILVVGGVVIGGLLVAMAPRAPRFAPQDTSLPGLASHEAPPHSDASPTTSTHRYPVTIHRPAGPPRVAVDTRDVFGNPATVACANCHSIRTPDPDNRTPSDLDEFHLGMTFAHGTTACLSCHNPNNYDTLRLADGTAVEYPDVMTLCAQCHGPQYRDYQHGAHGGMNGYWDLTRGPRIRNNCVDCHDPHAPAFPRMIPTFKPNDRFLAPAHEPAEGEHG